MILPNTYDVRYAVNVEFTLSNDDMQSLLGVDKRHKLRKNLSKFMLLVGIYVNFKQKEKLTNLKKTRNGQQSLPVYQFK